MEEEITNYRRVEMLLKEWHDRWKKLFQMVPVAGILFGAYANRSMVKDLAESGTMMYQKRKILERLEQAPSPVREK